MPGRKSIFEDVIRNENSLTILLCIFLRYNKSFREKFLQKIFKGKIPPVDSEDINIQFNTKKYGRPDIIIKNDKLCILLEIKKEPWTELRRSQPRKYIDYLKEKNNQIIQCFKRVILLCPRNYWHQEQWEKGCNDKKWINFHIIYWNDIKQIIQKNKNYNDSLFGEFYNFLEVRYMDIKFTKGKLLNKTDVPEMMEELSKIVKIIHEFIISHYSIHPDYYSDRDRFEDGYDYKSDKNGRDILYWGIWYKFWKKQYTPLCFGVCETWDNKQVVKLFRETYRKCKKIYENDKEIWYMEPITKDDLCKNKEDIKRKIEQKIGKFLDALVNKKIIKRKKG